MSADASPAPSRFQGWWWLLICAALWTPLSLRMTPLRLPIDVTWFVVPCGLVTVWLLLRAPRDPSYRRPLGLREMIARSVLGAALLPALVWIHELSGGGALGISSGWSTGASAFLGLGLGLLAVYERWRPEPDLKRDLGLSLAGGWAAFLLLCVCWLQVSYVAKMSRSGWEPAQALPEVIETLDWLTADPIWTLRHFGWVAVCVGLGMISRARGCFLPHQMTIGACGAAACWHLFPTKPIIVFGLGVVGAAYPLVARLAHHWQPVPEPDAPPAPRWPLRLALALSLLGLLLFLGLWARNHQQVAEARALIAERAPRFAELRAELPTAQLAELHSRGAAVREDALALTRADELAPLRQRVQELAQELQAAGTELQRIKVAADREDTWLSRRTSRLRWLGGEEARDVEDPEAIAETAEAEFLRCGMLAAELSQLVARLSAPFALRYISAPAAFDLEESLELEMALAMKTPRGRVHWRVTALAPGGAPTLQGWDPACWKGPPESAPPEGAELALDLDATGQVLQAAFLSAGEDPQPIAARHPSPEFLDIASAPGPPQRALEDVYLGWTVVPSCRRERFGGIRMWFGTRDPPELIDLRVRVYRPGSEDDSYILVKSPQISEESFGELSLEVSQCRYSNGLVEASARHPLLSAIFPLGKGRGRVRASRGDERWELLELRGEPSPR